MLSLGALAAIPCATSYLIPSPTRRCSPSSLPFGIETKRIFRHAIHPLTGGHLSGSTLDRLEHGTADCHVPDHQEPLRALPGQEGRRGDSVAAPLYLPARTQLPGHARRTPLQVSNQMPTLLKCHGMRHGSVVRGEKVTAKRGLNALPCHRPSSWALFLPPSVSR